jgi:hypothetical protein
MNLLEAGWVKMSQYKIGGKKGETPFSLIFMPQNPVFMPKPPPQPVLHAIIDHFRIHS